MFTGRVARQTYRLYVQRMIVKLAYYWKRSTESFKDFPKHFSSQIIKLF